jgi:hypothetical protein
MLRVRGEKDHAHAVASPPRHIEAEPHALALEKAVRELKQDAGAVAGLGIAAGGGPVAKAPQYLEALLDDVTRLFALDMGDEAHAARVVLEVGMVEAVWGGVATVLHTRLPNLNVESGASGAVARAPAL